ncbi:MAG: hypothetical protein GY861_03495, partial [bacterium]|nr:hypothetical protein [bacterium]
MKAVSGDTQASGTQTASDDTAASAKTEVNNLIKLLGKSQGEYAQATCKFIKIFLDVLGKRRGNTVMSRKTIYSWQLYAAAPNTECKGFSWSWDETKPEETEAGVVVPAFQSWCSAKYSIDMATSNAAQAGNSASNEFIKAKGGCKKKGSGSASGSGTVSGSASTKSGSVSGSASTTGSKRKGKQPPSRKGGVAGAAVKEEALNAYKSFLEEATKDDQSNAILKTNAKLLPSSDDVSTSNIIPVPGLSKNIGSKTSNPGSFQQYVQKVTSSCAAGSTLAVLFKPATTGSDMFSCEPACPDTKPVVTMKDNSKYKDFLLMFGCLKGDFFVVAINTQTEFIEFDFKNKKADMGKGARENMKACHGVSLTNGNTAAEVEACYGETEEGCNEEREKACAKSGLTDLLDNTVLRNCVKECSPEETGYSVVKCMQWISDNLTIKTWVIDLVNFESI